MVGAEVGVISICGLLWLIGEMEGVAVVGVKCVVAGNKGNTNNDLGGDTVWITSISSSA